MKVAFFDRDGTIIEDYPDSKWKDVNEPIFLEDSISVLKKVQSLQYEIIIVSNQYLIGEGFITQEHYNSLAKKFIDQLLSNGVKILDIFYCPHSRNSNCVCCKPKSGMFDQALLKYPNIIISESFMVGNSIVDIGFAEASGIRSYGLNIETSYNKNVNITKLNDLLNYI